MKSFHFIPVFWLFLFVPVLLFAAAPSPETAANLTIQDTLPAASTYVTSSGGGTPSNGIVSWQIPTLARRASTAVITLLNPNQIYLPAIFN